MKTILSTIFIIFAFTSITFAQTSGVDLSQIKKIYLADLGRGENSDLVREKIRAALLKQKRFEVVETPEEADAALMGAAGVTTGYNGAAKVTTYTGSGIFRLVEIDTQKTVWTFEYKPGFMKPGASVSSRIATKAVKQLLKDANLKNK